MKWCSGNKKPIPVNKSLYNSIKRKIKSRTKVWPSAYASGQLVKEYKHKGGKYRCSKFGSLDRWFKEKWVDVCSKQKKGYSPCGRKNSNRRYPYCRPSKRINSKTPVTIGEIGKLKLKKMCSRKRKNPRKKVFLFGEKTNITELYKMENQYCGFGNKFESFYKDGTPNSLNLTPGIRNCESVVYGEKNLSRFGKKSKKFIQEAFKLFEKKGTKGSF
jgi:hypothetical protein